MLKYFIPGPSAVLPQNLEEMSRPMIGHRGQTYAALHGEVIERFKSLFECQDSHVFLVTSSASGIMEGAVRNCVHENVLHTVCGAFSDRWREISYLNNKKAACLEVVVGKAITPDLLKDFLKKNSSYEAITFTYCETSTGVLNPLKDLCKITREFAPEMLILVDAVSAFGGVPLQMQEWGVDVLIFGLQKCLALPPGLAMVVVSERAYQKSLKVNNRGYYFNFEIFEEYNLKNNTPATPAISLIYALRRQLEQIEKEGLSQRYLRHYQMWKRVNAWVNRCGFSFFSAAGFHAPTVSAVNAPEGFEVVEFVQNLKDKGFTISAGYGDLKQSTFRIGHMGDVTVEDIDALLETMTEVFYSLKLQNSLY